MPSFCLSHADVPDGNRKDFAMALPPHDIINATNEYDTAQLILILTGNHGNGTEADVNVTVPAGATPKQNVRTK